VNAHIRFCSPFHDSRQVEVTALGLFLRQPFHSLAILSSAATISQEFDTSEGSRSLSVALIV